MTVNTEDIYREMGWQVTTMTVAGEPTDVWTHPSLTLMQAVMQGGLPDPLTDWNAFGEILEWADREGYKFDIRTHPAKDEGETVAACYRSSDLEIRFVKGANLREAALAALSEAVRE